MKRLINEPFHSMHRVMDMLCLNFGQTCRNETISIGNRVISQRIFPVYSLHIQVQWRFIYQGTILLGSRDIYKPFSNDIDVDMWDYNPTNRPDCESSLFDVASRQVSEALTGHYVTDATVTQFGDVQLKFSNDYVFEVFIPASYKDEEWRLIDVIGNEHLVFHDTN